MNEFFMFSWESRMLITVLLGFCILFQTLAIIFNFYRNRFNRRLIFKNLLEIAILGEILLFSLLHGQVVNGYKNGFVVPTGHENMRIIVFYVITVLVIIVCFLNKAVLPLSIIPIIGVSLPISEVLLRTAFPWFFIATLIIFLGRSIKICTSSMTVIGKNISALSVIRAIDSLDTGVLFSKKDGYTLLANQQMQKLMIAMTGKIFRNAIQFYETLISKGYESRYSKIKIEEKIVYILPDETAWMLTKTDVLIRMKNYIHISLANVTELWRLTIQLQIQDQELRRKSDELKETMKNLHILSKKKEIENAKMRAHDILGQRLSVLLRIIQSDHEIDYELLRSLAKGLVAELRAEQNDKTPYDELKSIQQIFDTIGVDIQFEGQLPDNAQQADLFIDIIREGSTNAVRHGFATQVNIKSEVIKNTYHLTIKNNGYITQDPIVLGGGISVMKKRVNGQGGQLDIIQSPMFTLYVIMPGDGCYE